MEEAAPSRLPVPLLRAYHLTNIRYRDVMVIARCQPETREIGGQSYPYPGYHREAR